MQRRQFIQLAQGGLISTLTAVGAIALDRNLSPAYSQNKPKKNANNSGGSLSIEWLGHMSFLISGGGATILTHPFKPAGCTANKPQPKASADLILVSSRLLDEGYLDGFPKNKKILAQPGSYNVQGLNIQGIRMDHDRLGGRRFGTNVAWRWQQSGIRILHLGGAAAPIEADQRILMGRPDVVFVPVGGGPKGYTAAEAQAVVNALNPRLVIPTHYRTAKASDSCELTAVDEFLTLMSGAKVQKLGGSSLQLTASSLPESVSVRVFG
jgi:L-ascorbate metabolism protein UlaG (beta-lactamase superfamily)